MFENYFDIIPVILPKFCTTPCVVELYDEGIDEDGARKKLPKQNLMCHHQIKHTRKNGDKDVGVSSAGVCYFVGDIAPELPLLVDGKIEISGRTYEANGEKFSDLHGKVIYTLLTLK